MATLCTHMASAAVYDMKTKHGTKHKSSSGQNLVMKWRSSDWLNLQGSAFVGVINISQN